MPKQEKSYAVKIRKNLKKTGVVVDPLLDGLLEELQRLEKIRNSLYEVYSDTSSILEKYTNKAGAENIVVSAVVKEYKMYSQRFNEVTKTLEKMLEVRVPEKPKEPDQLDELNGRDRM
jgi:hypothetical protein